MISDRGPTSRRIFGWWYICIGLGFIALGTRSLVAGAQIWAVGLRFLIAIGFLVLGMATLLGKAK